MPTTVTYLFDPLIATNDHGSRLLRGDALYGSFDSLLSQIAMV